MICVLAVRMCCFPSLFPKGTELGEMDLAPEKTTPRLQKDPDVYVVKLASTSTVSTS